jgi:hypothetical protein
MVTRAEMLRLGLGGFVTGAWAGMTERGWGSRAAWLVGARSHGLRTAYREVCVLRSWTLPATAVRLACPVPVSGLSVLRWPGQDGPTERMPLHRLAAGGRLAFAPARPSAAR